MDDVLPGSSRQSECALYIIECPNDLSSVRLKVEQEQLVSGGWSFGLGSIGLQGA